MKQLAAKEICPTHDKCQAVGCGQPIGRLPALVYKREDTGREILLHVMCSPPPLRKAYHERQGDR